MNQQHYPRDWAYMASFKRKDLPSLYEMARQIQQTHNTDIIEDFNQKCEQQINGKNPELRIGDKTIGFEQVVKSEDLVVLGGLDQCIRIIQGTSAVRWQYMVVGTGGNIAATTAQTALTTEGTPPRIDMSLQGWRESVGMKLFFGGVLGETGSFLSGVDEIGVFNSSAGTTMLNRIAFNPNPLSRTFGANVFILSSVVEFCPVT